MKKTLPLLFAVYSLLSAGCGRSLHEEKYSANQYKIKSSDTLNERNQVSTFILPFHDSLQVMMNEIVGVSDAPLTKGNPESTLGDFVADACAWVIDSMSATAKIPRAEFTMLNSGGLRTSLPKGNITRGNIFELMPFENELVILTLDAVNFQKLVQYIAVRNGNPVSGLQMQIKDSSALNIKIRGADVNPNASYAFTTSDYLANGGDNLEFLSALPYKNTGIKVRDAIFLYLKHLQVTNSIIHATTDGRIYR